LYLGSFTKHVFAEHPESCCRRHSMSLREFLLNRSRWCGYLCEGDFTTITLCRRSERNFFVHPPDNNGLYKLCASVAKIECDHLGTEQHGNGNAEQSARSCESNRAAHSTPNQQRKAARVAQNARQPSYAATTPQTLSGQCRPANRHDRDHLQEHQRFNHKDRF